MCIKLTSLLPAALIAHYQGVHDLKHLRAKDLVDCLYSLIILGTQIWNILQFSHALFWTSVALNCFTCLDFLIRLIEPDFSFVVNVANYFQRRLFPGPPEPFPKTVLIARIPALLMMSIVSVILKILVASDNPVQVIPNGALMILLAIEAKYHFCPGYIFFGLGVKFGLIPIPAALKPGQSFQCSCVGPTIHQEDVLLIESKPARGHTDEVQSIETAGDVGDDHVVQVVSPTEDEPVPVSPPSPGGIKPERNDSTSPVAWSN